MRPATPQKRTHDSSIAGNHDSATNSSVKSSLMEQRSSSRQASPALSSASSLTELSSINDVLNSAKKAVSTTSGGPPAKKRKLGFIEKQVEKAAKQKEKDEKARAKAEEKHRKEEEKARKDEEKRRQAEEKEAAKRVKELEKAEKQAKKDEEKKAKDAVKAEKEAKKQKEEEEKLKKERAQMRLGAFFGKPKPEATPPSTPEDVSEGASSRRSSIASIDMEKPVLSLLTASSGPTNPEYEKWILPFFVPEYTEVAPYNRFKLGRHADFSVTEGSTATICDLQECFGRPRKRLRKTIPVKEVIRNMRASGIDVVELDGPSLETLARTPYKHLQFCEDVRPPYQGTYSRPVNHQSGRKLARNPFIRGLPETNYDYDSEAEWEPPGEDDEDLEEDDEMSDADDGEDEMADFLDDADDVARRKGPLTDMEPISSGLCWVGQPFNDNSINLEQYRMDFLHDSTNLPIDPFATQHWTDEMKAKTTKQEPSTSMQPPACRKPLSTLSSNTSVAKQEVGVDEKPLPSATKKASVAGKAPRLIDQEFMQDFKQAVDGSDLTKAGLIEILKKQFPKCSKDAIRDTLAVVAMREGKKECEKKWVLLDS